jgi:hypothetical protein
MAEKGRSTVHTRGLLATAALAVVGTGCNNNPLVGNWATAGTFGTLTVTETVDVSGDGTLSVKVSGMSASCSGAWTTTGYTWAATATEITLSGKPACTGSITCGALSLSCSGGMNTALSTGSCTYALSNNDDTLALTACTGISNGTFTRAN